MFKLSFNKILILFLTVLGIFLFTSIVYSSNPFETPTTCSDFWGIDCNDDNLNDASAGCDGTQIPGGDSPRVEEIYINASSFRSGNPINVTCEFRESAGYVEYIWYYNTTDWIKIWNGQTDGIPEYRNRSVVFNLNSTEGTHIIRCLISSSDPGDECAYPSTVYDNDDINFTVTEYLRSATSTPSVITTISTDTTVPSITTIKSTKMTIVEVKAARYLVPMIAFAVIGLIICFVFLKKPKED